MNKDNANAAEKFRLITEAYEVLGNYRLRKLYDRGIIHTAGKDYAHHAAPEAKTQAYDDISDHPHDDPSTKFYKSRLRRQHTGQKIYDFDEWTKNHYSDTFNNSKKGKNRYDGKRVRNEQDAASRPSFDMSIIILVGVVFFMVIAELSVMGNLDRFDDRKSIPNDKKKG